MKYVAPTVTCWAEADFVSALAGESQGELCFAKCKCTDSGSKVCYDAK